MVLNWNFFLWFSGKPSKIRSSSTPSSPNNQGTSSSSDREKEVLEFVGSVFYIGFTPDKGEASNFYLRPIIQSSCKEDRYFHIVTDPHDRPPGGTSNNSRAKRKVTESRSEIQQQDPPGSQNASKSLDTNQVDSDSQNTPPPIESNSPSAAAGLDQLDELEPQRYVSVVDDELVAGLNLKHLKKGSVFKLKHLHEDVTQPLSQSQWLPESLRGSQPHILCRQGNTLRSKFIKGKLTCVYIDMEKEERLLSYGKHVEGDKRYSYFILEDVNATQWQPL